MPLSAGFADQVVELLEGFGSVQVKRMFGGAALSRDGVGFAILDDDVCFLKADVHLGAELKSRGCAPWVHSIRKDGSVRDVAYWSLPDSAMDDPDEACELAHRSFAIALAVEEAKKKPGRNNSKPRKPAAKEPVSKAVRQAKP